MMRFFSAVGLKQEASLDPIKDSMPVLLHMPLIVALLEQQLKQTMFLPEELGCWPVWITPCGSTHLRRLMIGKFSYSKAIVLVLTFP